MCQVCLNATLNGRSTNMHDVTKGEKTPFLWTFILLLPRFRVLTKEKKQKKKREREKEVRNSEATNAREDARRTLEKTRGERSRRRAANARERGVLVSNATTLSGMRGQSSRTCAPTTAKTRRKTRAHAFEKKEENAGRRRRKTKQERTRA